MKIRELLRDLKLNKYESIAYEVILKRGVVEASIISKEGDIPFGKIYESLGSLSAKGLIEVQNTRPKKYKIRNPKTTFRDILNKKQLESEEELKNLKDTLLQIENEISKISVQEHKEKTFWITAIGKEIDEMMGSIFSEAKNEIFMIPYIINKSDQTKSALLNIPRFVKEINKTVGRGVKIKVILPEKFAQVQIKILKKMRFFDKIIKNVEIRILGELSPEPFTVIDSDKVVLRVNDPINKNKILAMIKIIDNELSKSLKEKFNEMWKIAKPIKEN